MLIFLKKLFFAFKESLNSHPEIYPIQTFDRLSYYIKDTNLEKAVDDYLNNYKIINKIAIKNNAKYFNFLQPTSFGKNKQLSSFYLASNSHLKRIKTKDGITQADVIFNFFSMLYTKIKHYKNIINLQSIFDQIEGEIYIDHVHFSDKGNNIIAKAISEKILEDENE
jgi:lysophospholipase L1-like esterase|tara:strand:+ start:50 stop:550 length:501 start_codon:yes stop_codon:yes gene_type:complete